MPPAFFCKQTRSVIHGKTASSRDLIGVERVFSAAGKMHGGLSKSAKDETLEASLFAAFNTD